MVDKESSSQPTDSQPILFDLVWG